MSGMTPERLAAVRERVNDDHSQGTMTEVSLAADARWLLAEVDRLRAQLMNLDRWVERVTLKRITPEAVERGARYLFASRYFGDEDFADEETARIYREESEGCLRAALASGDEVQP